MKLLYTIVLVGMALPFTSFSYSGNPTSLSPISPVTINADEPGELVVAFENYSVKRIEELNALFAELPGIKPLGSCERFHVFYFNYDTTVYRTQEEAFEAIMIKTREFRPLLKEGSSISHVKNNC